MNIAFFLGGFKTNGGIGRVTSIIANALAQNKNHHIKSLSFFKQDLPNLYVLDPQIKESYLFDGPLSMSKAFIKGGVGKLRRYLKEEDIDILIVCGALYFPLGVIASKGLKTKIIAWEHSNARNRKDHKFQIQSRYVGAKFADAVVTLTKKDQQYYQTDFKRADIHQIYNPVDTAINTFTKPYDTQSKKIISVGRLSYQKHFTNLIEVAQHVLPSHPDWQWHIFGEGEERAILTDLIEKAGLEKQLFLLGQVDNLYERYNDYSLQVMTSRYEGFPMSLLEGMTCGLPLVSYDVETGPNEIIEEGRNGFLISPFNVKVMSQKIEQLINHPELRVVMSRRNHELKENYQLDEIINQWDQLFEQLR